MQFRFVIGLLESLPLKRHKCAPMPLEDERSAGRVARAKRGCAGKAVRAPINWSGAGADDLHGEIETRFFEMNDHFHGLEFRLRNRIERGIGSLKVEGFGMFFSPLAGTGIKLAGRRVAEEHFHALNCAAIYKISPILGVGVMPRKPDA